MAKLAVFDMDGALLVPDHRLNEQALAALKRLWKRNIALTFATGRHVLETHHMISQFSLSAFLITGNGMRIHSRGGKKLYRQDLASKTTGAALHSKQGTRISMHALNDGD